MGWPYLLFSDLKYNIYMYVFVCKLLPRVRERGQQVLPDCLVRIYWRAHVGDWCVVTWRDCTWWMGVFVSTPPIPRRGCARAAAIRPMWATWKGLRYVGGGRLHLAWRLVAGGIVGPPSTDRSVQAWTIRPSGLERLDNFKIKFQTYIQYWNFRTRITSSDLCLCTQLGMSISL